MKKLLSIVLVMCVLFAGCSEETEKSELPVQVQWCKIILTDSNRLTDTGQTIIDFEMSFHCEDSENHKGIVYGEVYISSRQEDFKIVDAKITSVPWTGHPWQFQGDALENITHNGNRAMISVSGLFEKENTEPESQIDEKLPGKYLKNFESMLTKPKYERVNMLEYSHYIYRADIWQAITEGRGET